MPKATWYTPIARLKNREEVYAMIDRNGWKTEPMPLDPDISYFNTKSKCKRMLEYDHYFAFTKTFPLWDSRKAKDNTEYLPTIRENIFQQEQDKIIPVLTSLNYGRPALVPYDELETAFNRSHATSDFYRKSGVLEKDSNNNH